jgi:hypothetical protein
MFSKAPTRRKETRTENGSRSSTQAFGANQKVLISARHINRTGEVEGFPNAYWETLFCRANG